LDGYVEVARRLLEAGAQPVQVDWETPAPLRAVIEDFDGRSR
jgi:hypothetical protein